jgi:hypothetical protein
MFSQDKYSPSKWESKFFMNVYDNKKLPSHSRNKSEIRLLAGGSSKFGLRIDLISDTNIPINGIKYDSKYCIVEVNDAIRYLSDETNNEIE